MPVTCEAYKYTKRNILTIQTALNDQIQILCILQQYHEVECISDLLKSYSVSKVNGFITEDVIDYFAKPLFFKFSCYSSLNILLYYSESKSMKICTGCLSLLKNFINAT